MFAYLPGRDLGLTSPYHSAIPFAASLSLRSVEDETLLSLDSRVLYARQ